MPLGAFIGGSLNLSFTKPAFLGTPTALFFTRCTTLYAPCSPTDPNNLENLPYIRNTDDPWILQKNLAFGQSYTCYAG